MTNDEKEAIKEVRINAEYCINEDTYLKYDKYEIEKNIIPILNYIDEQDKIIHKMAEIIVLNTCEKKLIGRNLEERIDIVIEDIKKCISQ